MIKSIDKRYGHQTGLIWVYAVCPNGFKNISADDKTRDNYCDFGPYNVCCFVALRPKSTAMVIAGRSVHLTTLFPGQA